MEDRGRRGQLKKLVTPLVVLALAGAIYALLINTTSELGTSSKEPIPVAVRALTVQPATVRLSVTSQGNVQPRTETKLVAQVPGEVVEVASNMRAGAEFRAGDVLLRLDPRDYDIALERARASQRRATAEQVFASSEAQRVRALYGRELVSATALQQAERALSVADAAVQDAAALVKRAEVDLERTAIVAPFNGRVRRESIDVGQFLQKGASIATVYDTDRLEVRLPLANSELAFLDLAYATSGMADNTPAEVTLTADYAGERHTWQAKLIRTEGDIAIESRFLYAIAEVSETVNTRGIRLPIGLFVDAHIQGRSVDNLVSVPRMALRDDNTVMIIDDNDQLRFRRVTIFRRSATEALISSGLSRGDRVCTSSLQFVVEGMPVQVIQ